MKIQATIELCLDSDSEWTAERLMEIIADTLYNIDLLETESGVADVRVQKVPSE